MIQGLGQVHNQKENIYWIKFQIRTSNRGINLEEDSNLMVAIHKLLLTQAHQLPR